MFTSLRSRLIGSYVLIILICLILVGLILLVLLGSLRARLAFIRLADAAIPTAFRVRGLSPVEIANQLKDLAEEQGFHILILTPEGKVLADTQGDWTGAQDALAKGPPSASTAISLRQAHHAGRKEVSLRGPAHHLPGARTASPVRGPDHDPSLGIQAFPGELSSGFLLAGGVAFLVSILLALLIARSIAKPLQRIAAAAEEIARGN